MPQFDVYEVDYSAEELEYFEKEMRKYKLPWITKVWKKFGVPFIRYSFLPAIILIVIFGAIYNGSAYGQNDWMWGASKGIALFYILGFGLFTLISHVSELITANKLRKRLGLSQRDFKIMVIAFQITGMD
jgi:uncharacterized membrane protein YbhN (UPF0104 family)